MWRQLICLLFGHRVELRQHPVGDATRFSGEIYKRKDFYLNQLLCNRCLQTFAKEKFWRHDYTLIEEWLRANLPERELKKLEKMKNASR